MLAELYIQNFAVIRETRIEFGPGMNALTGETGAGKSIVLDALGAVLGERTSSDLVRTGAERAYIEAIFDVPAEFARSERLGSLLSELGIEMQPAEPIILSRDITAIGRSTARINGRAVTARALTQLGELLVDIHGQSDHLSLLRSNAQLDLLDRYAGTLDLRQSVRELYRSWREVKRQIETFDAEQRQQAQRIDLLRYQLDEIKRVAPGPDEEDELSRELSLLTNAERLTQAADRAHEAFSGGDEMDVVESGALDQIRVAEAALEGMQRFDDSIASLLQQLRDALFALDEIDSYLRDYRDRVQYDPERLSLVNERLAQFQALTRKYGPNISAVIEYQVEIEQELEQLGALDVDVEALRQRERQQAKDLSEAACALSTERKSAATGLATLVGQNIAELNMGRAAFEVRFSVSESESGIEIGERLIAVDETGYDRVSYYLAANRGEELRPLARVASGGETARLMLALKSILSTVDDTPTLVFDEIDVGVGGRSGQVVGEKLWNLTHHHQVIVISHLPQVAAFADRHTAMIKHEVEDRTETRSAELVDRASIDEIATMFDGMPVTPESRANAQALVKRVNAWKQRQTADAAPA